MSNINFCDLSLREQVVPWQCIDYPSSDWDSDRFDRIPIRISIDLFEFYLEFWLTNHEIISYLSEFWCYEKKCSDSYHLPET